MDLQQVCAGQEGWTSLTCSKYWLMWKLLELELMLLAHQLELLEQGHH